MLYLIEKVGEGEDDSFLASYLIYSNFTQLSVSQREKKKKKKPQKENFLVPKQNKKYKLQLTARVCRVYMEKLNTVLLTEDSR